MRKNNKQELRFERPAVRGNGSGGLEWGRNTNMVRTQSKLGLKMGNVVVMVVAVMAMGLFGAVSATRGVPNDYNIADLNGELAALSAQKSSLEIENMKLASLKASEESDVAKTMENATIAGYVEE